MGVPFLEKKTHSEIPGPEYTDIVGTCVDCIEQCVEKKLYSLVRLT